MSYGHAANLAAVPPAPARTDAERIFGPVRAQHPEATTVEVRWIFAIRDCFTAGHATPVDLIPARYRRQWRRTS